MNNFQQTFLVLGCDKADEPATTAEEGAHHQRNHRDEVQQASQRSQLSGRLPRH